jgi:hypothetical protein
MSEPIPSLRIRVEEALTLVELALQHDDLERATQWGALALSVNDPKEPADA